MNNLSRLLVPLLIAASLLPSAGCYFGRSPSAKTAAYAANGTLLAAGGAMFLGAALDGGSCGGEDCTTGQALGDAGQGVAAVFLVGAAALGIGVNLLVSTKHPAPPPSATLEHEPPGAQIVTAPGLAPATVHLR